MITETPKDRDFMSVKTWNLGREVYSDLAAFEKKNPVLIKRILVVIGESLYSM